MTALYFLVWVFLYFSEIAEKCSNYVFAPQCALLLLSPCTLRPLEPGHRAAEPAPCQGPLRHVKDRAPSTRTTTKTPKRLGHHQNTNYLGGFNS